MEVVYGISRWTNASRASAVHVDMGEGKPLCGGNGRKAFTWAQDEGEPTCAKCIRLKAAYDAGAINMMDIICLDCKRPMGQKPGIPGPPTSSLCPECNAKWHATLEEIRRQKEQAARETTTTNAR